MDCFDIRQIADALGVAASVEVIRQAFATVADEFALTQANAPTHPAFIAAEGLYKLKDKGAVFFGAFFETRQIGFVAIERANEAVYYMEKLAVLPEYRRQGAGRKLLDFSSEYVRQSGGGKISIGVISEHTVLKRWYQDYGFVETATKKFSHLAFGVCFMEKIL